MGPGLCSPAKHLHQGRAGERGAHMDQCRFRDRTREMWDETNVMGFTQVGDFDELRDAADVRHGGPRVVDQVLFHQFVLIPTVAELLANGYRHFHETAQGAIDAWIFRAD